MDRSLCPVGTQRAQPQMDTDKDQARMDTKKDPLRLSRSRPGSHGTKLLSTP
jgi:hypothetical protein